MKIIEKYRCEICNTEYADKKRAEACEQSHKRPAKIVKTRYLSVGQNESCYPISITVKMDDGKELIYRR